MNAVGFLVFVVYCRSWLGPLPDATGPRGPATAEAVAIVGAAVGLLAGLVPLMLSLGTSTVVTSLVRGSQSRAGDRRLSSLAGMVWSALTTSSRR